jgi:hypothetical protein
VVPEDIAGTRCARRRDARREAALVAADAAAPRSSAPAEPSGARGRPVADRSRVTARRAGPVASCPVAVFVRRRAHPPEPGGGYRQWARPAGAAPGAVGMVVTARRATRVCSARDVSGERAGRRMVLPASWGRGRCVRGDPW